GVCGSEALAYEFSHRLQHFMFPRAVSPDLMEEVSAIKHRIERDIVGKARLNRNVKLGRGGIREIEFIVQTLQLLQGARNAFLQGNNTLKTLEALRQHNLLSPDDATALAESYRFLRKVEHRLQIEHEAQTHTLPENEEALNRLGKTLGFDGRTPLLAELARHMESVRAVFDKILRAERAPSAPASDLDGFEDPAQAAKELHHLREGGASGTHIV